MIQHTALFRLKHQPGSAEEADFLRAGSALSNLSMVRNFKCLRQVSDKNPYTFCFSMEFDSEQDYQAYNNNPFHCEFVETRWKVEVSEFMEVDYVAYRST